MEHESALSSTDITEDRSKQVILQHRGGLPNHIAIIMDGNGRWARKRGQYRVVGHRQGTVAVRDVTEVCAELGVNFLTLYTFSTENWHRPTGEVNALMQLLIRTIRKERDTLMENNIRLMSIGDISKLPPVAKRELEETISATAQNSRMTLTLALSYSGRWDILRAVRELARNVQAGTIHPDEIDEVMFTEKLSTVGLPDPDLLIRTGGEQRVSNFLLWQIAYTELYITDVLWPDFRRTHIYEAIQAYQDRDRRFGRVH